MQWVEQVLSQDAIFNLELQDNYSLVAKNKDANRFLAGSYKMFEKADLGSLSGCVSRLLVKQPGF